MCFYIANFATNKLEFHLSNVASVIENAKLKNTMNF